MTPAPVPGEAVVLRRSRLLQQWQLVLPLALFFAAFVLGPLAVWKNVPVDSVDQPAGEYGGCTQP